MVPEWFLGFFTALLITVLGWFLTRLQSRAEKCDEQRQAAAAFRFELESNLGWLDDILDSHNYLRDDAWVQMKNRGYISYLPSPIPLMVIKVYDQLHTLNELIRAAKDTESRLEFNINYADEVRNQLRDSIKELIRALDDEYPKIARNFRT